jgi:ATP synthase protein I
MIQQVQAKQRQQARRSDGSLLRSVAILGVVGWSVVLPTLIGIAAGIWIDKHWHTPVSWTLILMASGLLLGCANAWQRIRSNWP